MQAFVITLHVIILLIVEYHQMMNIYEIRYKNARYLSDLVGGTVATAEKLNKSSQQISHLLADKPFRNIGMGIARQFEIAFNKPKDWLDHYHPELWGDAIGIKDEKAGYAVQHPESDELSEEAIAFAKAWQDLCPEQRAVINSTVQAFIYMSENKAKK